MPYQAVLLPLPVPPAVILGLFTLPKIYEMRKDEIDSAVGTGREALQKQYNTAQAKVGAAAAACMVCCAPVAWYAVRQAVA